MDPDEVIRALVSVGLVVTLSLGANCQGAVGGVPVAQSDLQQPTSAESLGRASSMQTAQEIRQTDKYIWQPAHGRRWLA